jgi:transposase
MDEQWASIEPYIPPAKSGTRKGGRPGTVKMREVVHVLMYFAHGGDS